MNTPKISNKWPGGMERVIYPFFPRKQYFMADLSV